MKTSNDKYIINNFLKKQENSDIIQMTMNAFNWNSKGDKIALYKLFTRIIYKYIGNPQPQILKIEIDDLDDSDDIDDAIDKNLEGKNDNKQQ